jgi:hypothetical protein
MPASMLQKWKTKTNTNKKENKNQEISETIPKLINLTFH